MLIIIYLVHQFTVALSTSALLRHHPCRSTKVIAKMADIRTAELCQLGKVEKVEEQETWQREAYERAKATSSGSIASLSSFAAALL